MFTQNSGDIESVQVGHHDIEQHQIGWIIRLADPDRFFAILDQLEMKLFAKYRGDQHQIIWNIVNHQNGWTILIAGDQIAVGKTV